MEAGLCLLPQPPQKVILLPPPDEHIGDDLFHPGVLLRLRPGEIGVRLQNKLPDFLNPLLDKRLARASRAFRSTTKTSSITFSPTFRVSRIFSLQSYHNSCILYNRICSELEELSHAVYLLSPLFHL